MKKLLISSALIAGFILTGCQSTTQSNKNVEVTGVRKANLNEQSQNLPELKFNTTQPIPGQAKAAPASFPDAPPMIPHTTDGMVPITKNNNMCLNCHMPTTAKAMKVTSVPNSHIKNGKIDGRHFNCTLCHASQAKLDPVIQNRFNSLTQ